MSRKPRIHFPGAVYHVILRGNAGRDVFSDATDRSRFHLLLQDGAERFGHRIHAFCLMTNHIHLAVQVGNVPLARIMQNLSFRYTQFFNRKRHETGHLFQGRYKALLIDADDYLLELVRYIHLNPVRGGIVKQPEDYPWSSHRAYLGREMIFWLTTDWIYGQFSEQATEAVRRFSHFVTDGMQQEHRREFHSGSFEGRILGDDRFVEEALARSGDGMGLPTSLDAIVETVCSVYDLQVKALTSRSRMRQLTEARAVAALLVREESGLLLADLAKKLNQDLSSLSQSARRLELRMNEEGEVAERLAAVRGEIPICQA